MPQQLNGCSVGVDRGAHEGCPAVQVWEVNARTHLQQRLCDLCALTEAARRRQGCVSAHAAKMRHGVDWDAALSKQQPHACLVTLVSEDAEVVHLRFLERHGTEIQCVHYFLRRVPPPNSQSDGSLFGIPHQEVETVNSATRSM